MRAVTIEINKRGRKMLYYNKYLKELGITEDFWLFNKENKENDSRYLPDEEGFVNAEFFNLDTSLSLYIYSQLCYFRDNCLYGGPAGMSFEKWKEILDKMIEAFRLMILQEEYTNISLVQTKKEKDLSKNKEKKIRYGLKLFIKYYHNLWF